MFFQEVLQEVIYHLYRTPLLRKHEHVTCSILAVPVKIWCIVLNSTQANHPGKYYILKFIIETSFLLLLFQNHGVHKHIKVYLIAGLLAVYIKYT